MNDSGLTTIGVAIPAHNEESLLPGCLNSIAVAATRVAQPVRVCVALDRCSDDSAAVVAAVRAEGLNVSVVYPTQPGVGAARGAAVRGLLTGHDPDTAWLACTDADSLVPADWFRRQLDHAGRGAEVVVGTIAVADWSEHPPRVREHFLADYRPVHGHRHMHGANLSFRADRYLAVGGFAALDHDEDVGLIARFERQGAAMVWAADLGVQTSARRVGRAPAGFAEFLLGLEEVT